MRTRKRKWIIIEEARVDWQQTAGPIGGVVNRMKTINGEVWASLYSGGIYKFADNRWQQIGIGHGLPENRIFDFVVAPDDPKTVFAAQLVACLAKSADGGKNWQGLCSEFLPQVKFDNYSSKALAFDPKDNNVLYIAGKNERDVASVIMSPDRGKTWKMVHDFAKEMPINHLVFFHDRLYLATENDGVYRSDDRGKSWKVLSAGLDQMPTGQFVVDPDGKNVYLFTGLFQYNLRNGGKVYVLDEEGSRWKPLGGPEGATSMIWNDGALWVGTVAGEIWRKDAKKWVLLNRDAELPSTVTELAFTDKNTLFAGVRGFGIYRSKDGGKNFTDVSTGLIASATREVYVDPANAKRLYVISWDRPGIYASTDGGASFTVLGKDVYVESIMPLPQDFTHMYAAGMQGFYDISAKSADGTWQERVKPGPPGAVVKTIAVDPVDGKHLLIGLGKEPAETPEGYGVYESRDGGKMWKKVNLPDQASYSILFNPKNPRIVYAALLGDGVYKSLDSGETFNKIKDERLRYTYRMAMSAGDPNVLLAGSNLFFAQLSGEEQSAGTLGGLFKSTDGGATWKDVIASIRDYGPDEQGNFNGSLSNFGHMPNFEQMLIDPRDHRHMLIGHHGENVFMT
ncbi:hypothetical protein HYT95_01825, partial [Candidatus Peregrinibacteria bacterium]|nr:hypothetical protein [Candidatus Peregrinibacteria bacterium]